MMIPELNKSKVLNAPYLNPDGLGRDIGNLMVLAPHPDDESLGCGGLIAMLREAGCHVHILFITSGSASHPNSQSHPPQILSKIREKEAVQACSILGVPEKNVQFFRQADSGLNMLNDLEMEKLDSEISEKFNEGGFTALAIPWRRDPHADHRVVNTLGNNVVRSLPKGITIIEYPIWMWKNGQFEDWPLVSEVNPYRLDISRVFTKKWNAIQAHHSQLGSLIKDDPGGFVLTEDLLKPFQTEEEYFFITNSLPLSSLNGSYFEGLYAEHKDPWNFKASAYEHEKYALSVASLGREKFGKGLELGCSVGVQTRILSDICDQLLAVDVSATAIAEARLTCKEQSNINFEVRDVCEDFPEERFDVITLCELGYYFNSQSLDRLYRNIFNALQIGGKLLMVHWTPYVPTNPLTGDNVHDQFEAFAKHSGYFKELIQERHKYFRLQVWQKMSNDAPNIL